MRPILLVLLLTCGVTTAAMCDRAFAQTAPAAEKNGDDSHWALIKDTTNADLLRDFLEYFPNSRHAAAARARLATITAPKTGPAKPAAPTTTAPATPAPSAAAPKPAAPVTGTPAARAPAPAAPTPAATGTGTSTTTVSRPAVPATSTPAAPNSGATTTVTTMRRIQLFQEPRGDDNPNNPRVDWCLNWATNCGKPAADAFCRSRGFQRAASFESRLTGGPTWVAGDRRICQLPECTALAAVMCEGRDETQLMQHERK